jgi:hypothetical protein
MENWQRRRFRLRSPATHCQWKKMPIVLIASLNNAAMQKMRSAAFVE